MIQILAQKPTTTLSVIKEYMTKRLMQENQAIQDVCNLSFFSLYLLEYIYISFLFYSIYSNIIMSCRTYVQSERSTRRLRRCATKSLSSAPSIHLLPTSLYTSSLLPPLLSPPLLLSFSLPLLTSHQCKDIPAEQVYGVPIATGPTGGALPLQPLLPPAMPRRERTRVSRLHPRQPQGPRDQALSGWYV